MSDFKARIVAELDTSKIEQQINQLNGKNVKFNVDTGNTQKDINGINNAINTVYKNTSSFGDTLKKSLNIGSAAAITAKGFQLIRTAANNAVEAVKELDGAIVDLQMATNQGYEKTRELVSGYNQMAKELGATTTQITNAADAWLRQGNSLNDTNTLIRDSMILSKVGQLDSAEATQYLTSAMKGYKVEAEGALEIVDKLTAVDLVSATNAGGLAEGMSEVAVTAENAGISMDKLLGYLAATGEVTQESMSTIGTSFKTIFTRMSDIKSGKLELIDEDGTTEILSDVEQTLANVGIDLRKTVTENNNYGDVLDNLAAKWDSLSQVQQNALAKAFAGTRQQNRFRVLMENYDNAKKYMDVAANSAGTAESKFSVYLDSIEAKINSLQAAFESLVFNSSLSNMFSGIVEASTAVLEFVDNTHLLQGALAGLGMAGAIEGFKALMTGIQNSAAQMSNFHNALQMVNAGTALTDSSFQQLLAMTNNLSQSQLKAVLSSQALSTEQRIAILTSQGMSVAEAKAALSSMGLATAEGAATTSTVTLSSALKGLWATLKANPLILIIAGVTAGTMALSALNNASVEAQRQAEEQAQKSKEAANAAKEESSSLTELISKYKELASADKIDTETRAEIKDIQSQISDLVGSQADNLDLVNGKLDEELNKLQNIQKQQSENNIPLFEKAYIDARDETNTYDRKSGNIFRDTSDSDSNKFTFDYWGDNAGRDNALKIINKDWEEKGYGSAYSELWEGDFLGLISDSYSTLDLNDDLSISKQIEAIDSAITALETNYEDYANNGVWKKLIEIKSDLAGDNGKISKQTEAARDLLDSLTQQEVGAGKDIETVEEFQNYQKEIIDSISNNGVIKQAIEDGTLTQDSIDSYVEGYLGSLSKYDDIYNEYIRIKQQQEEIESVKNAFKASEWYHTPNKEDVPSTNASTPLSPFMGDFSFPTALIGNEQRLNEFNNWFDNLSDEDKKIVYQITCETDTAKFNLEDWQNALENYNIVSDLTAESIQTKWESSATKTNEIISNIGSAQDFLSSQKTGISMSIDDFNSEELADYRSVLEYTNGTMQLNADKVNEIIEAKSEEQIALNNTNKALAQSKYLDNAKKIEEYREQLRNATDASDSEKQAIQNSIDALLDENSTLADTCSQYDLLSASLREATGAYQHWLNSQSASDYGDMADDALSAIQQIRDTYDSESDIFGNFGSKKFDAAVEFIIPDSVSPDDLSAIESYMADFKKYLSFNDDGGVEGLNIDKFLSDSVEAGLMSYSEDDGFQVLGGKKMEDFAKGLNLSSGVVQAFFDELQLKGGEFDWGDEAVKTIGDLAVEANEAAESLRKIDGNSDLKIKMDVSDLTTTEEQVAALDDTIAEMDGVKAKPGVDSSEIDNANAVIQYCLMQKQLLTQPDVMRVDTSQVEGDIGNAISLLQQFQTAQNDLEIKQKIGADTTSAETEIASLTTQIQNLSPDIKTKLSLDSTSTESIKTSISSLTAETINVKANVDASAITGYTPETKQCDVIYNPKTDLLPQSFDSINRTVVYKSDTSGLPQNFSTITRYVNYVKTGNVDVNGTAHLSGTAKAGGDWGTAPGGETLVGELGREIVVDPHTGKWYTVGDNGAEFRNIPAGAIVFNHLQTEHLLANGYVSGRASALVGGTAMVTGGYKPYTPSSSSSSNSGGSNSGSSSNSSSKSSSNSSSNNKSSSSDDKEPQIFDWIEIALERIQRLIENISKKAESTFKKLSTRLKATNNQISKIKDEIALQQQGADRYMQEANAVGLSSDLAKKVRDGTIDISEYDEDTQKLIDDYQKWYEKALDCKDAIADLHEELASLYQDNFDKVRDNYENKLSLNEHLTNSYETGVDLLETKGYLASTKYYAAMQNVEEKNIATQKQELADLEEQFSIAMNSGEIEKYSEAWYGFQQDINACKEGIAESEVNLAKFAKTMREIEWERFDYIQDRISQITQESDFLIDLMSNGELYTDKGQLNDEGMATMGLHGQNYNVYMAQADQYAQEILDINKQIAKDPYNTELIARREELLGLQQDSILAAEDEKQAIRDMVEEGIQKELDALKELISAYTDSLDSAKNLYDYQNKVADKTKEIASLQKQLSAFAGDDSEETKAQIQKLEVDLTKAQEDLAKTEYDQFISDQKKLLDELYNEYEEILNQRLDNIDLLITDMIEQINLNADNINTTLTTTGESVGYTMSENMQNIWNGSTNALDGVITKYGDKFDSQFTSVNSVLNSISVAVASMVSASDTQATETVNDTKTTTEPSKTAATPKPTTTPEPTQPAEKKVTVGGKINAKGAKIYANSYGGGKANQYFASDPIYTVLGENNGYWKVRYHKLSSGVTGWFKKGDVKAYKTGGLVDYTGLAQLDGTPGKPELVLNSKDTENFIRLRDALRAMASQPLTIGKSYAVSNILPTVTGITDVSNMISKISATPTISQNNNVTFGDIKIDHVEDYNDFVTQLQRDPKFEQMIQAMTTDILGGGSPLSKYKYHWK